MAAVDSSLSSDNGFYKYATAAEGEFPRTAMVMICSLTVVLVIAVIVFCVFLRCHSKSNTGGEHYAMAVNGKASGYAPISAELSPPLGMDPSTQPLLPRQAPQVKGGYQPLNGAVVPNGNGVLRNGNGVIKNGSAKKKDFKEWYV